MTFRWKKKETEMILFRREGFYSNNIDRVTMRYNTMLCDIIFHRAEKALINYLDIMVARFIIVRLLNLHIINIQLHGSSSLFEIFLS